ncbi:MAG: GAF domain-containing protein [Candidatus Hodarchaeales archaeon]|jgi:putative methionine-R-sulfoxide reductase with GAF domain
MKRLADLENFYNLESFPYGIAIINKKTKFIFVNHKLSNLFQYSEDDFLENLSLKDLFFNDQALEIDLISNRSLTENLYLEQDLKMKNGEETSIGLQIVPITKTKSLKRDPFRILIFQDLVQLAEAKASGIESFSQYARNRIGITIYTLGELGPELYLLYNEMIFENYEELMIKFGIYLFTTIGQGLEHSTGLYGPLPVPDSDYLSIVYALELPDSKQNDSRETGTRYSILSIFFPSFLEFIFTDRRRIRSSIKNHFDQINDLSTITNANLKQILEQILYIKEFHKSGIDLEKKFLATFNIGRILTKTTDLKSAFDSIATFCEEILHYKIFTVLLVDKMAGSLKVITTRGYTSPTALEDLEIPINKKKSVVAKVVRNGSSINIPNTNKISYYLKVSKVNLISELAVPIFGNSPEDVIGVIDVESDIENAFNADDEMLLSIIAETASGIIQRYRKEIHLESLHNLAKNLARIHDLQEAFEHIANFAEKTLNFSIFGAFIVDEENNELKFLTYRGYNWKNSSTIPKMPLDSREFLVTHVVQTKKSLYVDDLISQNNVPYHEVRKDVVSEYAIPLMDLDQVVGVLNVESTTPLSNEEIFLFEVLAHHATITLRLYRKSEKKGIEISSKKKPGVSKKRKRKRRR